MGIPTHDIMIINNIKNGGVGYGANFAIGILPRRDRSPDTEYSPGGRSNGSVFHKLGKGGGDNSGGDGDDSDPDIGDLHATIRVIVRLGDRGGDFTLVKSSNIIIAMFCGMNLSSDPYLQFTKSLKRLIYNPGVDGKDCWKYWGR